MIQNTITKIQDNSSYNLWKNSLDTINWFVDIENEKYNTFIQFDIIDFYPSISKELLLLHSLNIVWNYTDINENEYEIILTCRKSILINNNNTWVKNHVDNFDVTMGSFDSGDFVGIYTRSNLSL